MKMKVTRSQLKDNPSDVFDKALSNAVEITFRGRTKHILISPNHPAWIAWLKSQEIDKEGE